MWSDQRRAAALAFGVLHDDGGVLEEGDEQVAGLEVWVQGKLRRVHHYDRGKGERYR